MDWVSVSEAAAALGVSARQVRNLAEHGALPARKLSSGWLVSAAAVRDRARHKPPAGRPLSAPMAWLLLAQLDARLAAPDAGRPADLAASLSDRRVRHRLRALLADPPAMEAWAHWLGRRANSRRLEVHPGVLDRLAADPRVRVGGAYAAALHGAGIGAGAPRRLYVSAPLAERLIADFHAVDDVDGNVELMVMPEEAPALPGDANSPVPLAVALADLLGSSDAREDALARDMLSELALAGAS